MAKEMDKYSLTPTNYRNGMQRDDKAKTAYDVVNKPLTENFQFLER